MSTTTPASAAWSEHTRPVSLASRVADWIELTKPKISVMVVVAVAAAGYIASLGQAPLAIILHAMFGALCLSASASATNQWWESSLDARMRRTRNRPLPAGRLAPAAVMSVAGFLLVVGAVHLALFTTWQAAAWGVGTWLVYVLAYTPLKTRTPWNTAVGAVSGAMPLLLGWTAVDGALSVRAWSLFTLLYLWQFPHFMAIAWIYRKQYAEAGMLMLPVLDPAGTRTGVQAVLGAAALLPISCLPVFYLPGPGAALAEWRSP